MTIVYKTCSKCKQNLPATIEYFHRKSAAKDGLQYACKKCKRLQAKTYEQLEYVKEAARQHSKRHRETEVGRLYHKQHNKKYRATIKGYLHHIFARMKERCNSPSHPSYKNYGGRGIKVCFTTAIEFVVYVMDVLRVDPRGLQIDRINNNGNYEKDNIRFVTRSLHILQIQ